MTESVFARNLGTILAREDGREPPRGPEKCPCCKQKVEIYPLVEILDVERLPLPRRVCAMEPGVQYNNGFLGRHIGRGNSLPRDTRKRLASVFGDLQKPLNLYLRHDPISDEGFLYFPHFSPSPYSQETKVTHYRRGKDITGDVVDFVQSDDRLQGFLSYLESLRGKTLTRKALDTFSYREYQQPRLFSDISLYPHLRVDPFEGLATLDFLTAPGGKAVMMQGLPRGFLKWFASVDVAKIKVQRKLIPPEKQKWPTEE